MYHTQSDKNYDIWPIEFDPSEADKVRENVPAASPPSLWVPLDSNQGVKVDPGASRLTPQWDLPSGYVKIAMENGHL